MKNGKKVEKICSPCENCAKKGTCSGGNEGACVRWKTWFKDYWRRLRHMYGMDKAVKDDDQ